MSLINSSANLPLTGKLLPRWKKIRANGKNYFLSHGLPTRHDEDWKYTSVASLKEAEFALSASQQMPLHAQSSWLNKNFDQIVFIDGFFSKELSTALSSAAIEIFPLEQVLTSKQKSQFLQRFSAARKKVGKIRQDSFEALNSAHAFSGVVIFAKKNQTSKKPLQILFLQSQPVASYPKIFVIAELGSKLTLLETYAPLNEAAKTQGKALTDSVTEILVEPQAKLDYVRMQSEALSTVNIGTTRVFLKESSQLKTLAYSTGATLSRHNLDIHCLEKNASAQVDGVYLSSGNQHMDHHTWIDHVVGECQTTQTYKGILDQSSRAVFNGKVVIRQDAQKASSEQLNHNLILNSQAEVDSKPELEIYADDVKATHGSTVGQLNQEELFYLLSRAISREQAVEMLSLGFVNDLVEKVENPSVREFVGEHLRQAYWQLKDMKK